MLAIEKTRDDERLAPRRVLGIVAWCLTLVVAYFSLTTTPWNAFGLDSHAYWSALRSPLYDLPPATKDAFLYSPAFAHVTWPLAQLPWPAFGFVWSTLAAVAFLHLLWPLGARWAIPLTACCLPEILTGNVFWLLALVAVYGFRWPALWAVPLLTKLTPGLGPLWYLVRREWRPLGISLAATCSVVLVSMLLGTGEWIAWTEFLATHASDSADRVGHPIAPPLALRLPMAVAITVWAALTNRRWLLPVAMIVSTPVFGIAVLTMLAAVPRLIRSTQAS